MSKTVPKSAVTGHFLSDEGVSLLYNVSRKEASGDPHLHFLQVSAPLVSTDSKSENAGLAYCREYGRTSEPAIVVDNVASQVASLRPEKMYISHPIEGNGLGWVVRTQTSIERRLVPNRQVND